MMRPALFASLFMDAALLLFVLFIQPLLEINLTIDAATITAFFVGVVACFSGYGALQQRQVTKKVEAQEAIAIETKKVVDETHVLTNSGLTDIKAQLVTALADRDQLQIALATANERLVSDAKEKENP